jgi:hypothetical protein
MSCWLPRSTPWPAPRLNAYPHGLEIHALSHAYPARPPSSAIATLCRSPDPASPCWWPVSSRAPVGAGSSAAWPDRSPDIGQLQLLVQPVGHQPALPHEAIHPSQGKVLGAAGRAHATRPRPNPTRSGSSGPSEALRPDESWALRVLLPHPDSHWYPALQVGLRRVLRRRRRWLAHSRFVGRASRATHDRQPRVAGNSTPNRNAATPGNATQEFRQALRTIG